MSNYLIEGAGVGTGARIIAYNEKVGHCVDPTADPKGFFNHSLPKKVGVDCNVTCKTFTTPSFKRTLSVPANADILLEKEKIECSLRR